MKVKVLKDFISDENAVIKGTIIEVSDEFGAELLEKGTVEAHVIDKSVKVAEVEVKEISEEVKEEVQKELEVELEQKNVVEEIMTIEVKEQKVAPEVKLMNTLKLAKAIKTGKWTDETKAIVGQGETTAADGGALVDNMIVDGIYANAVASSNLMGKCQQKPVGVGYNGMEIRQLNESAGTPADYNGINLQVVAEGVQINVNKIAYTTKTYAVNKLCALVPFTSEIMEDVPGIIPFTEAQVGAAYGLKIDAEILYGTSSLLTAAVGNAGSKAVTLADASAPTLAELREMYMSQINIGQSEWIMSGAVYENILGLESTLGQPVLQPNYAVSPFGTLLGRPVSIVNCMLGLNGEAGTIGLVDMSNGYVLGTKGGVKMARSIHVYFDVDNELFRWILRVAGGPTKAVTMTLADGRTVAPMVFGHDS